MPGLNAVVMCANGGSGQRVAHSNAMCRESALTASGLVPGPPTVAAVCPDRRSPAMTKHEGNDGMVVAVRQAAEIDVRSS